MRMKTIDIKGLVKGMKSIAAAKGVELAMRAVKMATKKRGRNTKPSRLCADLTSSAKAANTTTMERHAINDTPSDAAMSK